MRFYARVEAESLYFDFVRGENVLIICVTPSHVFNLSGCSKNDDQYEVVYNGFQIIFVCKLVNWIGG